MDNQLENNLSVIDTLNDLIQINNDRIQGSEKVNETNGDEKYKTLLDRVIEQSTDFRQQLISEVRRVGGQAEWNGNTGKGKLYSVWLDIKSAFTGEPDSSGIEMVQFSEDAARKAYDDALSSSVNLPSDTKDLLETQRGQMNFSFDLP